MIILFRKDPSAADPELASMADQSASPLLSLPAELRNQIWMHVLVQNPTTTVTVPSPSAPAGSHRGGTRPPPRRFCANILRTCRQAHREGTPILYGENTFSAHASLLAALPSLLLTAPGAPHPARLPPVTHPRLVTRFIRRFHLHVRLDTDPRFSRAQVQESFDGAAALELDVFQAMYGSCDFAVLRLFEGVRAVGRALVRGSVGDGKYAAWLARCMEGPPGSEPVPFSEKYIGGNPAWDAWQHGHR